MENIIFYAPYLVCIILLFIVGSNYTKINKYKSNVQFWHEAYDEVSKRIQEMTAQLSDLKTLLGIRDNTIELLKTAINERSKKINELESTINTRDEITKHTDKKLKDQSKIIQDLSNELEIKNTTIESLMNHLQEKAKEQKPLEFIGFIEKQKTKKGKHKDK